MIQANDLRVGNKIEDVFKNIVTVRAIHGHENTKSYHKFYTHLVMVEESGNQYNLGEVTPIPLIEEWLVKFGYKKDWTGFSLPDKNSVSFSITKDNEYLACWLDLSLGRIIRYVHQLQNLYYSLCGEELQINPAP